MNYKNIKSGYRSGESDLLAEFFDPCFSDCSSYSRAVGFFTSTALKAWALGLTRMGRDKIKIRLLIGPTLSDEDYEAISLSVSDRGYVDFQGIADEFVTRAFSYIDGDESQRLWLFRALVESGALEIRFAFTDSGDGIYHEKIGVFTFPNDDWVSFDGSLNESGYAHTKNFERIHVFRSWVAEDEVRGQGIMADFESAWTGSAKGLKVLSPSKEVLKKVLGKPGGGVRPVAKEEDRWRHQGEAVKAFLDKGRGVLEMATGTGKTRTALKIVAHLISEEKIDSIIVTMNGTDLLDQWYDELLKWQSLNGITWPILRHYERFHDIAAFEILEGKKVLLVSRLALNKISRFAKDGFLKRSIVIHDEVHGLGSPENRLKLSGFHSNFDYVLGLSATPERQYDEEGTQFIISEIGDVIYRFGIEDAIQRGILTELDYIPLTYSLSDIEKKNISKCFALKSGENAGKYSDEDIWRMIAAIYKAADSKIDSFSIFLESNRKILDRAIIFVYDTAYGEKVMQEVHPFSHNYKGYFSGENRKYLEDFASNKISTLVTCHRLSQGIDISDVACVVLFSSDRAKLETIQRIGRCLRVDPNNVSKRAMVIDFIMEAEGDDAKGRAADEERKKWLESVSKVKKI